MKTIAAVILTVALAACSSGPGDTRSFRQSLADAIAPEGHTPQGGQVQPPSPEAMAQAQAIEGMYQADIARQQAGMQSVAMSQVTIYGGRINVPVGGVLSFDTDWRPAGGVATATVAECQSAPLTLHRGDKTGAGVTLYATRINGIVYIAPWASQGCRVPGGAQGYPGHGRFPLNVQGKIMGGTVQLDAWGGHNAPYDPYRSYR